MLPQSHQAVVLRLLQPLIEIQQQQPIGQGAGGSRWCSEAAGCLPNLQVLLHQRQVGADVGIPTEVATDGLNAVVTPAMPTGAIGTRPLQTVLQGLQVSDIHQQTVVTAGQDVARSTVIGRHHRQTAGRRFQQRQTEGSVRAGFTNRPRRFAAQR